MKLLIVLAALVALCAGSAIPLVPGDNSHYVEGKSRFIWFPSDDGIPVLVDLHEPVDEAFLRSRNGANNEYWLFTRSNPTSAQILVHGDANSITNSNYNGNLPTKVITHGWNSSGNSDSVTAIRDAYLAIANVNVIVLDWRGLAGNINYITAANGVPNIGQFLGNFVTWLFNTAGGDWNQLHMMGHSLGAHVMGNAGRTVGGIAARISGLDPAGPLFGGNSNALTSTDGQYVECIHTDGGLLGIRDPICTANFYPNGGDNPQPGCWISTCSHGRAPQYMASSVRTDHFTGRLCTNLSDATNERCSGSSFNMGNSDVTKQGSGLYGLTTGSSWPY